MVFFNRKFQKASLQVDFLIHLPLCYQFSEGEN